MNMSDKKLETGAKVFLLLLLLNDFQYCEIQFSLCVKKENFVVNFCFFVLSRLWLSEEIGKMLK